MAAFYVFFILTLIACEEENISNSRSLSDVNIGIKSSKESKLLPHTESSTFHTLNGSVEVQKNTFESPVLFDVTDTGDHSFMITSINHHNQKDVKINIKKDLNICLYISENSLKDIKIKVSNIDRSNSIHIDGYQDSDKICIQTKSIPGFFSVVFPEENQLGETSIFHKDFAYGYIQMSYDQSTINQEQIYFIEDPEKKGVMKGGLLDNTGQEVSQWLSTDIELCWKNEASNVTTMTFLNWDKNKKVYIDGVLKNNHVCFKPTNFVGSFILGSPEITTITTEKSVSFNATPVLSLDPVSKGNKVSIYTNSNCDGEALVSLTSPVDGALSLSPRLNQAGIYKFFARSETPYGGVGPCSRSYLSYTLLTDLSPPTELSLISPLQPLSSDINPVVRVSGVEKGAVVGIYKDILCENLLKSKEATTHTIDISLSNLSESSHVFYAKMSKGEAVSGCSQASLSYTVDITKPIINQAVLASGQSAVASLNTTFDFNVSGASDMYITTSSDCSVGGSWEGYETSKNVVLSSSNESNVLYVKFRDKALNETLCVSDAIVHDNIAPQSSSIVIAGGNFTIETAPNLTLNSVGATEMYITNTSNCNAGGHWAPYATQYNNWDLEQSNNLATVYVKYRDESGNESSCVNDTITHDDTPPTSTSIIILGGSHITEASPNLSMSAINVTEMYITNISGCSTGGNWENYSASKSTWPLAQTNANTTVYAKFRDEVGNESLCVSDSVVHDDTAPSAPSALTDGTKSSPIATPTLTWVAGADTGSGVHGYDLSIGTSAGLTDVLPWTDVGQTTSTALTS